MKTIAFSKKKYRELLSIGEKFELNGPDSKKVLLLRSILFGFIRQRRAAAREMENREYAQRLFSTLYFLEERFGLIKNYNYWRHCLEIKNAKDLILFCLPSEEGYQKRIRLTMIGFIDRAEEEVQKIRNHA